MSLVSEGKQVIHFVPERNGLVARLFRGYGELGGLDAQMVLDGRCVDAVHPRLPK